MIRWTLNKIMKWIWGFNSDRSQPAITPSSRSNSEPIVRINLHSAMNGKILEIATPCPKIKHDWVVTNYIVTDGESLTDALAILLIAKGIK